MMKTEELKGSFVSKTCSGISVAVGLQQDSSLHNFTIKVLQRNRVSLTKPLLVVSRTLHPSVFQNRISIYV